MGKGTQSCLLEGPLHTQYHLPASVLLEKGQVPPGKCQSLGLGDELISGIRGCAEEALPSLGSWAGEGHLGAIPDVYLWGWGKVPCPLVIPQFSL